MEYKIKLSASDVKGFVEAATKSDCHIDVATNNHNAVDAKSILGVLGLDLSRVLTVTVHGFDSIFDHYMKSYSIAC